MHAEFWHEKWRINQIGFHNAEPNPLLVAHIDALSLAPGSRVFLPLCGKTRDIAWLLSQGFRVAGAELSPLAVEQLFGELGVVPHSTSVGSLTQCSAPGIDIFIGDIFAVEHAQLGNIDAVYDRGAYVALPEEMRAAYAAHVVTITDAAPQLLISFDYDQALLAGPPFSINDEEIRQNYEKYVSLTVLARVVVTGGLKGKCPATENVWLLSR